MSEPVYGYDDAVKVTELLIPHWAVIAVALDAFRDHQFAMAAEADAVPGWAERGALTSEAITALDEARSIMPVPGQVVNGI